MNTKIREQQLKEAPESIKDFREAINAIKTLQKKYGEKIKNDTLQKIIKETDPTTHTLLAMLIKTNSYNTQSIQTLYALIKKHKELHSDIVEVKVTSWTNTKDIEQKHGKLETQETHKIGISIKKGESIYKRDLDNDVNKLLS